MADADLIRPLIEPSWYLSSGLDRTQGFDNTVAMPAFITRVELHGANTEEYEVLHGEMQRRGFGRQVLSSDRTRYDLPSSMYRISDKDLNAGSVRDLAKEAASRTGKRFWIFAVEYVSAAWVLHATDDAE